MITQIPTFFQALFILNFPKGIMIVGSKIHKSTNMQTLSSHLEKIVGRLAEIPISYLKSSEFHEKGKGKKNKISKIHSITGHLACVT